MEIEESITYVWNVHCTPSSSLHTYTPAYIGVHSNSNSLYVIQRVNCRAYAILHNHNSRSKRSRRERPNTVWAPGVTSSRTYAPFFYLLPG